MLSANAEFNITAGFTAPLNCNLDQFTNPLPVQGRERVTLINALGDVNL